MVTWQEQRRRERRETDWIRKYFSLERVLFIKQLPCSVPGCKLRPSENAHGEGGGTGRKAGWESVLPLCSVHHKMLDEGRGRTWFERNILKATCRSCAERTQELWLQAGDFPNHLEF